MLRWLLMLLVAHDRCEKLLRPLLCRPILLFLICLQLEKNYAEQVCNLDTKQHCVMEA